VGGGGVGGGGGGWVDRDNPGKAKLHLIVIPVVAEVSAKRSHPSTCRAPPCDSGKKCRGDGNVVVTTESQFGYSARVPAIVYSRSHELDRLRGGGRVGRGSGVGGGGGAGLGLDSPVEH